MAKRRKQTLFDVIHTGQPIGLQVKDRSATARLEPRRPFDRYGRATAATAPRGQKLSAAEELANLRRELGAKPADGVEERSDPHRAEHAARAIPLEPEPSASVRVSPPRAPRKPIGEAAREAWDVVSPRLNTAGAATMRGARAAGRGAAVAADATWQQALRLRDVDTRYLMSAGVALAAVALLTGTFYVGRMLARRPTNAIADVANVDLNATRPNVLNLGRPNDANLVAGRDAKLERQPEPIRTTPPPVVANPSVFGGRDLALNYVVVARYETATDADAAVEVLAKYNVKTTVERNLPGWEPKGARDRFYVVGTDGFAKISGASYTNYTNALSRISDKEAGNNLPAKLTPAAYKYQRAAS